MKQSTRFYFMSAFIVLLLTISCYESALAQPPPPPPGGATGGGHNLNINQGSGAPVGDGVWILIALAFSYGLNTYIRRKEVRTPRHSDDEQNTIVSNYNLIQKQLQIPVSISPTRTKRKSVTRKLLHKPNSFKQFIRRPHFVSGHLNKPKLVV